MPLVRLYPYNPAQGFVLRTYTLINQKLKFVEARGWYEVSADIAKVLEGIPQESRKPRGPKAFMVAKDKEEAKKLDADLRVLLRKPEEDSVGTIEEPVPMRPGKRGPSGGGPKSRSKRSTVAVSEND